LLQKDESAAAAFFSRGNKPITAGRRPAVVPRLRGSVPKLHMKPAMGGLWSCHLRENAAATRALKEVTPSPAAAGLYVKQALSQGGCHDGIDDHMPEEKRTIPLFQSLHPCRLQGGARKRGIIPFPIWGEWPGQNTDLAGRRMASLPRIPGGKDIQKWQAASIPDSWPMFEARFLDFHRALGW
jgi:hypothetical protein